MSVPIIQGPGAVGIIGGRPPGAGGGGDEHFDSVAVLCGFNGNDGATEATDDSNFAHTVTFSFQAQLDTEQKKFGTASLLLDGNDDHVEFTPSGAEFDMEAGDFTIEAWIRRAGASGTRETVFANWNAANGGYALQYIPAGPTLELIYKNTSGTLRQINSGADPNFLNDTWYHVAFTREGDTGRFFVNGAQIGSSQAFVASDSIRDDTGGSVGAISSGADEFNGWIDELRVTKGVARYTEAFTPPDSAFPRS